MDCVLAILVLSSEPPLTDRFRFPPREVAYEALRFNREYRRYAETRKTMELHHSWYWQEVVQETDYLYHCWDWLHAAQGGEGRDEEYWRRSLRQVRDLIGEDAYFQGAMPPTVPVWYFQYVN